MSSTRTMIPRGVRLIPMQLSELAGGQYAGEARVAILGSGTACHLLVTASNEIDLCAIANGLYNRHKGEWGDKPFEEVVQLFKEEVLHEGF